MKAQQAAYDLAAAKAAADRKATDAAAMAAAQTVYINLQYPASRPAPSTDFLAFYNGIQALGRYQLVSSAKQADIDLFYDPSGLAILHAKDGVVVDTLIWNGKTKDTLGAALYLVDQVSGLVGDSKPVGPLTVLPAPESVLTVLSPKQVKNALLVAQKVYLMDRGVPNGFFVADPVPVNLLKADLVTWGRYEITDNLADADLVILVSAFSDDVRAANIKVDVHDAKTMQSIWSSEDFPWPINKNQMHAAEASLHTITKHFEQAVGDPVTPP